MRHFRLTVVFAAVAIALFLSACSAEKPAPVRTYSMGERVELGHIVYTVFETQWLTHMGTGPDARIPQQRFFLIRMSAVNSGSSEIIVPNVSVEDDSANSFTELSNGEGVPQWIGFLRNVKPADSVSGHVVFDAPPRHYKLRVTDETGERAALIDIPLTFSAETPDVPTPGSEKGK